MKPLLLCLLMLVVISSHAQIPPFSRIVGTNLVDFSPIAEHRESVANTNNYHIVGHVGQVTAEGALIRRELDTVFVYDPKTEFARAAYGQSGLLHVVAAARMAPAGVISPGHYFALSREMSIHYRKQVNYEIVIITNLPSSFHYGEPLNIFAMPAGTFTYLTPEGAQPTVKRFDMGTPATSHTNFPPYYFKITTAGPTRTPLFLRKTSG